MNFNEIIHRCGYTDCYAINENELVINIKTNKDITAVNLVHGDPYTNGPSGKKPWYGIPKPMKVTMELKNYLVWSTVIAPEFKRLQYYFEIVCNNEKQNLFEDGLYTEDEIHIEGIIKQYFKYAWINSSDLYKAPEWVEDTCWYQIMPDRFCRIADFSDERHLSSWNNTSNMKYNEIYGGNLSGIISKLTYLHDLGINGIYLTPIFTSVSDHKYNTTDYQKIDPGFGSEQIFKELVEKAHNMGIRIVIDGVFNHCGTEFFAWKDVVKNGKKSKFYNWFYINKDNFTGNAKTSDGRYYSFAFEAEMPKLNTNNTEVANYFCGICKEWILKWNIDGIRFDVGNEISHSFIKKLHRELKLLKPDLFLLGEIWHDSSQWLQGDEYDSVMNYPFMDSIHNFFVNKKLEAKDFMYMMNHCYSLYMAHVNRVLFNFLDSHDVGRVYSRCNDEDIFFQQLAILMTMPGTPCIYYGTEIAMDGKSEPYNRKPMPWEKISSGKYDAIIKEVKTLIYIRRKYNATLKNSQIQWNNTRKRLVNYIRQGDINIEIYINAGKTDVQINLDGQVVIFARGYSMNFLAPKGTLILRKD